ncbi:protein LONGIFOLIA 1 [Lactuca sativa]|uniref:DUF4378 domain-containing protein n=1 Tax=Lactuca sativa TaxID=4236 RepID=A0A9R1UDE5_LACSA|nr:protein LONGIFOLIA 1 [Lactuca sativa]KAJ0185081.1 hypothetical protein LSAT_V11C900458400 [Lactuca sativa]
MAGLVQDRNGEKRMDKQIGCMSGFLQIFDRQQILAGKRIHSTKRLPPSSGVPASSETVSSVKSPVFSGEVGKTEPQKHAVVVPASPNSSQSSVEGNAKVRPIAMPEISQLLVPREVRMNNAVASVNGANCNSKVAEGDDKQRRSPSVIARLMGLEPLSSSDQKSSQPVTKLTLRRSASESTDSRDLVRSKYIDGTNFQVKLPNHSQKRTVETIVTDEGRNVGNRDSSNGSAMKSMRNASGNPKSESPRTSPWRSSQQKRSFFDSADFFPEPNQMTVSMHGDFEKKLKMRGMDEQSNDLGTLKQILEVLQLKGLLRSTRPPIRDHQQNFVFDRNLPSDESSIILMKPSRSAVSKVDKQRSADDSRGPRRYATEISPSISPKREGGAVDRTGRSPVRARNSSPTRIESNLKSCNSIVKRRPLSIEIQKRANDSSDSLRTTPINSPKLTPKRNHSSTNRSPIHQKPMESSSFNSPKQRIIKNVVTDDESSSISESTFSTPSTTDTERSKWEGLREGRSSLHKYDKLQHSVGKMNSATESPPISTTVLPSPVSVLDSGFDKDESSSPSHSIDYKATLAVDFEEGSWSSSILETKSTEHQEFISDDSDFIYISEILGASYSQHLQEDSNVFFSIEKQLYNTKDTSKVSKRQRKLVFDVIVEILEKSRQFPPWKKVVSFTDSGMSLKQIWSEFQKIREINTGDGLLELITGVLRKDIVGINDWEDYPIETSETILDIERMIFKDLVNEAIGDLSEFSGRSMFLRPQRKLVF